MRPQSAAAMSRSVRGPSHVTRSVMASSSPSGRLPALMTVSRAPVARWTCSSAGATSSR
nr:hypothetical protein [Blastococcus sp. TML/C7B]